MTLGFCMLLAGSAVHGASVQQMLQPENLSGRWEAPDGQGGYVGMDVLLSTTIPTSTQDISRVSQKIEELVVGLYRRSGSDARRFAFNFFVVQSKEGTTWDGRNLRIDSRSAFGSPAVHIDLRWDSANEVWTGAYQYSHFKTQVIRLKRPHTRNESRFVGTWSNSDGAMNNCLHVVQAEDGTFAAWSDDIQVPGRVRYANGLKPPERTPEGYGEIAKITVPEPNCIQIELRAFTAMCCSHFFSATISRDGNSLAASWPPRTNQAAEFTTWTRVRGNSCRTATSA